MSLNRGVVALVFVSLSLAAMPIEAASQAWFLHGEDSAISVTGYYELDMQTATPPTSAIVSIINNDPQVWITNVDAAQDVTFDASAWILSLLACQFESTSGGSAVTLQLGTVDAGAQSFTAIPGASDTILEAEFDCLGIDALSQFTLTPDAGFTVSADDHIAVGITCACTGGGQFKFSIDKDEGTETSKLSSPANDPGFPTPSLATIALFSAGALMVAGAAFVNRRK